MPVVGDRVQVPSKRVGQTPREGVVTSVSGNLLRVTWSSGEESTIFPSVGALVVVGKVRVRAKKATRTAKRAPSRTPSTQESTFKKPAPKNSAAKKAVKGTKKSAAKKA